MFAANPKFQIKSVFSLCQPLPNFGLFHFGFEPRFFRLYLLYLTHSVKNHGVVRENVRTQDILIFRWYYKEAQLARLYR